MRCGSVPFQSAMLLVDAEAHAAVDRNALRELGISRTRVCISGLHAARLVAGHIQDDDFRPDIILCHRTLADMDAFAFAELLRAHPRLLGLPLVLVLGTLDEAVHIDALAAGFSAILARPYSQDTLCKTLLDCNTPDTRSLQEGEHSLHSNIHGAFDTALHHYEISRDTASEPEDALRQGLLALQERRWDNAICAFHKALRTITLRGEAELGLAAAWRGKGDMVKYRHYLNEAAHTFTRAMQWHKARATYTHLLRVAPQAQNPFLQATESLIRAGKLDEAAETLATGYTLGNTDDIVARLAQACLLTDHPEDSAEGLHSRLRDTPLHSIAQSLDADIRSAMHEKALAARAKRTAIRERAKGIALRPDEADATDDIDNAVSAFAEDADNSALVTLSNLPHSPHRPDKKNGAKAPLFARIPVLGDALAVAQMTWKLLHAPQVRFC